jgi:hypothetical protein
MTRAGPIPQPDQLQAFYVEQAKVCAAAGDGTGAQYCAQRLDELAAAVARANAWRLASRRSALPA